MNRLLQAHTSRKLCARVHLGVGGLFNGKVLPLNLKTSLNANLVNIFNTTRVY